MLFRFISFFILLVGLIACQSSADKTNVDTTASTITATSTTESKKDPVYTKGLALVGKSDCLTCHKIDDKLIGPSYKEIANKYAGAPNDAITALARTIIQGGSGNWGNVPMTPHPGISQEDAETMVRYILTLN
ncbi:MAG: c-type cytochrome [Bacteroidota bacterium]|jgi:cytochrome c